MKTAKSCTFVGDLDVGATGLNLSSTVLNRGRIVSIHSSIGVNRVAAGMNRSGAVDESCRHRRSILRHCIDAGFSSFPSRFTPIYRLARSG